MFNNRYCRGINRSVKVVNKGNNVKVKISVCLVIRNGEQYMNYLDKLFKEIELLYNNYIFEYYIYENNSTDNTKSCIQKFAENRICKYWLEDTPKNEMLTGISMERGERMACIRNKLKDFHKELDSDYTLLLDCDVVFLPNTIERLINSFNNKIVMTSSFCICWPVYKNNKYIHYYDSFAVITTDNISYKETINSCLFKCCQNCILRRKALKINIPDSSLFDDNKIIKVRSAFGSCSLIKTEIYNKVQWSNSICEHHSFCEQVNTYGDIIINPTIKIFTTNAENPEYNVIAEHLIDK